jgi:hypothetical protein
VGIFRRSGSTPADEPAAGLDGESGETVEEQWPLGPTGRPLHPVGAYFEAAFRRFGINFTGYLVMTFVCALPTLAAVFIFRNTALSGEAAGALLAFTYALGFVTLTALSTTLVAGGTRERMPTLVVTCGVVGVLAGIVVWQFAFVAFVLLPFALFPPIVAASGDADGLRAVTAGVVSTFKWFRRTYACVFGLIIVAVALWFGFTGLFFAVPSTLRGDLIIGFTSLFMWPISALVFRNLYGDMTGRLVINAAPNEDANRKAAMKKRREKSKRNRERIKKVTGEE